MLDVTAAPERIVDDFKAALHGAASDIGHLREPTADADAQTARSAELMSWLYAGGWIRWGWPRAVGGFGGPATTRGLIYEQLARQGYPIPDHMYVLEVCGPAVAAHAPGLAAQLLPAALRGEELWCQGFSEPEAGSDLASLRTRATLGDDGDFVVNGQKVWTSHGTRADRILLLVRTGTSESRHRGLSMLLADLDGPGVERRPIALAGGRAELAEVFFSDVLVPRDRLVGPLDGGWGVAMDLLQYERGNYAWMRMAATASHLEEALRSAPQEAPTEAAATAAVGRAYLGYAALRARTAATVGKLAAGEVVGAQTSVDKLLLSAAEQDVLDTAMTLLDTELLIGDDPHAARWRDEWWYSRASSVYGGAREIQRSIIADRILKLPKEYAGGG